MCGWDERVARIERLCGCIREDWAVWWIHLLCSNSGGYLKI